MPRFPGWSILVALALTLARPVAAECQTNGGEISGVVRDASGAVLPGAAITAVHTASGISIERVTDGDGRFFLPALAIGTWDITAQLTGFSSQRRRGVVVEIGRVLALEFILGLQGLTEQIVVETTLPLLQTETAEISDVIENREVVQLPLNGRQFMSLAQLSDGVVMPPGGTRGEALQQAGPLPNVGGQRSGHNIYLLDGTKVTDELFNNLVINPSVDSIQEFKIQKSMYAAEFGGKASALINVATRAGGNAFHGSLFEFRRDEALDSPNYFQPAAVAKPSLEQDQFGGTLGGPIRRNRAFFFGSVEALRMRRSLTRAFSVPTAEVRRGDFSGLAPLCDPAAASQTVPCAVFPGNRIPASRIDPIAAALLQRVPQPSSPGHAQNLTAVERQRRHLNQFSGRVDHRLSDADQLLLRASTFDADETQPFGTSTLQEALVPGFGRLLTTTTRNAVGSHTRVFGTSWFNEFRLGWMSVSGGQSSINRGDRFASQVGLQGVTDDPRDRGFPQVSTAGLYSTFGDPAVFTTRHNQHLEIFENVTWDRGRHRIKFGAYFFHLRLRPEQADNARGAFTFSGQFTGNAFADFLLGHPASAVSGIGRGDEQGRTNWLHAYAQDDWRPRDNLIINAGLRYEYNQHMYDVNNRLSSIDLSIPGGRFVIASDDRGRIDAGANQLLARMPIPFVTSDDAGWGRGLLDPSAIRLAPRLGFAWSLNDSRAVIRGGYGVFLNQWAYSVQTAFARNLPFFFTRQVDVPADARTPSLGTAGILAGPDTGTVGASIMDYDYNVEYSQTWSGGLQYQLRAGTMAEVSYMGTWTLGADNATVRNVPEPGPGPIQARRPIPQLSRINAIRFDGKSIYHGLTLRIERRPSDRYAYNVSYTLSRSNDDASSPGATESEANVPQDVRNIFGAGGEWAPSSFDHRHQFIASGVYQLPSPPGASGVVGAVLSGWRANAIVIAQAGAPFTVNLGVDRANIGAGPAQRPDQLRDPNLGAGQRSAARWFDTEAFAMPAAFTFGTAPRNSVIGPGFASLDVALAKTWTVAAGAELELRWEVFNALNRANFDLPNRIYGSANFGRIFAAKSPREMQLGLRLAF